MLRLVISDWWIAIDSNLCASKAINRISEPMRNIKNSRIRMYWISQPFALKSYKKHTQTQTQNKTFLLFYVILCEMLHRFNQKKNWIICPGIRVVVFVCHLQQNRFHFQWRWNRTVTHDLVGCNLNVKQKKRAIDASPHYVEQNEKKKKIHSNRKLFEKLTPFLIQNVCAHAVAEHDYH